MGCVVLWPDPDQPGSAQLMQMAVAESVQGKGIGSELVQFLLQFAKENAMHEVTCHARHDVVPFYERHGFCVSGPEFFEVGVSHFPMSKDIA